MAHMLIIMLLKIFATASQDTMWLMASAINAIQRLRFIMNRPNTAIQNITSVGLDKNGQISDASVCLDTLKFLRQTLVSYAIAI